MMTTEEISVKEAAKLLGVHVDTVYGLVRDGHLPARKLRPNSPWRILRAAVASVPTTPKPAPEPTPEK
jgi:excisionase family DNA binding protein